MNQKAAFLDRDGIINLLIDRNGGSYSPQRLEDFVIPDEVVQVVEGIKDRGFVVIVITNQPDISRGLLSWDLLDEMHSRIKERINPLAIYVCWHDSSANCLCRKPKPGMILDACSDYSIDRCRSFLIGDNETDILAAHAAGVKAVLVTDSDVTTEADYVARKLLNVLSFIDDLGP